MKNIGVKMNPEKIKYTCPACKKEVEVEAFSNINVTLNPELKEKLFSGELFVHECPYCQAKSQVMYSFIYHDMVNKILISFGDEAEHVEELIQNLQSELSEEDFDLKQFMQEYRVRSVKNINDLFEKIYLFEAELDDRVIELCKLLILDNAKEEDLLKDEKILDIRYLPKEIMQSKGNITDDIIGMNIYCEGDKAFIRTIEIPFYDQTKNQIIDLVREKNLMDDLVIDQSWVEKTLFK